MSKPYCVLCSTMRSIILWRCWRLSATTTVSSANQILFADDTSDVEFNAIFHILQCLSEHCLQVRVLLHLSMYQRKDTLLSNSSYDFCFFEWYTLCYNLCSLIPVQLGDDVQIDSSGLF